MVTEPLHLKVNKSKNKSLALLYAAQEFVFQNGEAKGIQALTDSFKGEAFAPG